MRAADGSGATGCSLARSALSFVEWRCACLRPSFTGRLLAGRTVVESDHEPRAIIRCPPAVADDQARLGLGRLLPDAGHPVTADDFDQCLDAGRRRGRLSLCGWTERA